MGGQIGAQWAVAVVFCAAAVGLAGWAIQRRPAGLVLLAIVCLPAAILLKDDVRIFSFHGFMHASLVYRILLGEIPPGDPLFAGQAARYAWGHHVLIAGLCRGLGITPAGAFALFNLLSLGATAAILWRVAACLSRDRAARIGAVIVSLAGVTLFARGPLHTALEAVGLDTVARVVPLDKFLHVNNNQAGILCFAVFLWSLLRLAPDPGAGSRGAWALLFTSCLAAAFLYPWVWLACAAAAGACGVVFFALGRMRRAAAAGLALAPAAAGLVAAPYLLQIQSGRSAASAVGMGLSFEHVLRNGLTVLLACAGIALLIGMRGGAWRNLARAEPARLGALGVTLGVTGALYLGLAAPTQAEYKFLLLASLTAGLPAGIVLADLWRARPVAGTLLAALFLFPASGHLAELSRLHLGDATRLRSDGMLLRPRAADEDRLYEWIRRETSADAVFADTRMSVPVFGHRSLLVALDPARGGRERSIEPGWGALPSSLMLGSFGHSEADIRERDRLARALVQPGEAPPSAAQLAALQRMLGTRPVFAIARGARARARLAADQRFVLVFESGPATVFSVQFVGAVGLAGPAGSRRDGGA